MMQDAHFAIPGIIMFLVTAFAGFVAGASLIIAIGGQNAFVLRQGLLRRHVGLVVAICTLGDIVLIFCGVAGIGALARASPGLMQIPRFGGAAFLGIYGLTAAGRAWHGAGSLTPGARAESDRRRVMRDCLAFTFLNPHVYLDTMVLLGSVSTHYQDTMRWAFAVGACGASLAWFSTLGYGARLLLPVFRSASAWRALDALVAVFMLSLCLLLLSHPLAGE